MNQIETMFSQLKKENKKGFIGYLTAGDPSPETLPEMIHALEEGGCDLIEVGVPFSDPLADGPIIQAAGQRAIKAGITIEKIFQILKDEIHEIKVPIALMVYMNTITIYGKERFIKKCEDIGIGGIIVPDLPYEESDELLQYMDEEKVAFIRFATPTSKNRMTFTIKDATGFVYCVSSMGVTGNSSQFYKDIESYLTSVRKYTDKPLAIGFGISTPKDVKRLAPYGDAIIVGSAIVNKIHETKADKEEVTSFVKHLKEGLVEF